MNPRQQGSTFRDVVQADVPVRTELGAAHKTGLTSRERSLARALTWLASIAVALGAGAWWAASINDNTFEVADRAVLTLDRTEFETYWNLALRQLGYKGSRYVAEPGIVDVTVVDLYHQSINYVVDPAPEPIVWDVTPILPPEMRLHYMESGERLTLTTEEGTLAEPESLSHIVKLAEETRLGVTVAAVISLGGLIAVGRRGGVRGVGWTLRSLGVRIFISGSLTIAALWAAERHMSGDIYPLDSGTLIKHAVKQILVEGWFPFWAQILAGVLFVLLGIGLMSVRQRANPR